MKWQNTKVKYKTQKTQKCPFKLLQLFLNGQSSFLFLSQLGHTVWGLAWVHTPRGVADAGLAASLAHSAPYTPLAPGSRSLPCSSFSIVFQQISIVGNPTKYWISTVFEAPLVTFPNVIQSSSSWFWSRFCSIHQLPSPSWPPLLHLDSQLLSPTWM